VDFAEIVGVELYSDIKQRMMSSGYESTDQILHGCLTGLIDAFHELQDIVREGVDHSHTYVVIILML
jgi:hypothetical protein